MREGRAEVISEIDMAFKDAPWPFAREPGIIADSECAAIFSDFFLVESAVIRYLLPCWLQMAIDPWSSHLVDIGELVDYLDALQAVTPDVRGWLISIGGPTAAVLLRNDVVRARAKGAQLELLTAAESEAVLRWLLYVSSHPSIGVDNDSLHNAIACWSQRAGIPLPEVYLDH